MRAEPDVSVIVAVYNTMPYLVDCLESLVEQSIGPDRLEIVAVDDGSTDESGAVLDRFAGRFPGRFEVVHQANSGGPARPSNVALDLARGRYVFFVGSDDFLGGEAMERMVRAADRDRADVVMGKMVGVGGKPVPERAFRRPGPRADLYDWKTAWAISNTKLFRRSLVERLGLRFPEDMRIGSDQPFTVDAMVHARSITVLADYDYYYAVRRDDDSNVTYRSGPEALLECLPRMMESVAALVDRGRERDSLLVRHFASELMRLLGADFLAWSESEQRAVCAVAGALADRYLTDLVKRRLAVVKRARIAIAARADLDRLRASIRADEAPVALLFEGADVFARLPGFRDGGSAYPDDLFRPLRAETARLLAEGLDTAEWTRTPDAVEIRTSIGAVGDCRIGLGLAPVGPDGAVPEAAPAAIEDWNGLEVVGEVEVSHGAERSQIRAVVPSAAMSPETGGPGRWSVRVTVEAGDTVYDLPLEAPKEDEYLVLDAVAP